MEKEYIPSKCKFCGSEDVAVVQVDEQWDDYTHAVRCNCCLAEGPHMPTKQMAARMWGLAPVTKNAEAFYNPYNGNAFGINKDG